jgi:hypothetical protein
MTTANARQVQPEFFIHNGKISYQSVMQYARALGYFLNETERAFYNFIIDCTARFGRESTYLSMEHFRNGFLPDNEKCFAGSMPPPEVSRNTHYKIINRLQALGYIAVDGRKYTILLTTLPVEIVRDADVCKGFAARNRHNSNLRTPEGIYEWAGQLTERLLMALGFRGEAEEPYINNGDAVSPYSLYYKNEPSPSNKLEGDMLNTIRDIFMGKRSAAEILASVQTTVTAGRTKITDKRKKRRTLQDACALFEAEWASGQRDRDSTAPANRIVGKDRALLKNQIIKRSEGTDLDTDAFAYWVAKNWQAIGATYFEKAKRYPERPVVPWLIACFETYIIAYQQREHLDTEGTRSQTELLKRSAATSAVQKAGQDVAAAQQDQINLLEAQLREARELMATRNLDAVENDMVDPEAKAIIAKGRNMQFPDYDDEPAPKPKRRKRK